MINAQDDLVAFHASHLNSSISPFDQVFSTPPRMPLISEYSDKHQQEEYYDRDGEYYEAGEDMLERDEWEEEDDGLGYYPDGVKRTLTDEQIAMFRHSEIQQLLKERRRQAEAEAGTERDGSGKRSGEGGETIRSYSGEAGKVEQVEQPQRRVLGGGNKRKRGRKTMWDGAKKKRVVEVEEVRLDYDEVPKVVEMEVNYDKVLLEEGPTDAGLVDPQDDDAFVPLGEHVVWTANGSDFEYEEFLEREREELKSFIPTQETGNEKAATVRDGADLVYDEDVAGGEDLSYPAFSPAGTQTLKGNSLPQPLKPPTSKEAPTTAIHQRRRIVYGDNDADDNAVSSGPAVAAGGIGTTNGEKRVFLWPKIG